MSEPAFSVVIPAYNVARTLGPAIRSVLAQTRGDFELVVVDDGSTDATLDVARSFEGDPRVGVLHQDNRGLPAARNAGIAWARGPYISFLDGDDLWLPEYLEVMGEALDANRDAGLAYADAWSFDDETRRVRRATAMAPYDPPAHPPASAAEFLRLLVRGNFVFVSTTVRRAAIARVGAFNEALRAAEDYELWLRILAHGFPAVKVPGTPAIARDSPRSMSKDDLRMLGGLREVCRIVAEEHPAPTDVKQIARARMRWAEHEISVLDRRRRGPGVARVRGLLGAARDRLLRRRVWYREPPPEVAEVLAAVETSAALDH